MPENSGQKYHVSQFVARYEEAYKAQLADGAHDLGNLAITSGGHSELGYVRAIARLFLTNGAPLGKALDVGCGPGHMTQCLHDMGYDATGIDISASGVALAKKLYPASRFLTLDGTRPSEAGRNFSLILARAIHPFMRISDFDYHIAIVRSFAQCLSDRGIIVIMNPTPSALDLPRLRATAPSLGLMMVGPFWPNLNKRLRFEPRTRTDAIALSFFSQVIGRIGRLGLISVSILARSR